MCASALVVLSVAMWRSAWAEGRPGRCGSSGVHCPDLDDLTDDAQLERRAQSLLHLRKKTSNLQQVNEEGPCVWGSPHNQDREEPLCEDGAFRWDCVGEGRGHRLQCPPNLPFMCLSEMCGGSGQNFCCEPHEDNCTSLGGLRPANNCPPPEAPAVGCAPSIPLDLVFLVDSSGSMGEIGFDQSRHYLKQVISRLPLGLSNVSTHVSIVQFSETGDQTVDVPISDGFVFEEIEAAVNAMQWHTGDTHTGEAIEYVLEHIFPQTREGTADMIALITDGKANGNVTPGEAAAKAKDLGVEIIAIGVSDYEFDELMNITGGNTDKVLTVSSYDELLATVNQTVEMVCENAVMPIAEQETVNFTKHFLKSMLDDKCLAYISGDVWMKDCEEKPCNGGLGYWCQYWAYSDDEHLVKTSRAWAGTTVEDRCVCAKNNNMVKACSSADLKSWAYDVSTQQLRSLDDEGNCLERGPLGNGVKSEACNSSALAQKWQFVPPA